ncbi:hypothetical protein F4809DRAFT_622052 [Biscogniauxia mediterranea]|nr:hypothetical protein F4809DRAFT_622052 [Biscogniauxia mediterranea]
MSRCRDIEVRWFATGLVRLSCVLATNSSMGGSDVARPNLFQGREKRAGRLRQTTVLNGNYVTRKKRKEAWIEP